MAAQAEGRAAQCNARSDLLGISARALDEMFSQGDPALGIAAGVPEVFPNAQQRDDRFSFGMLACGDDEGNSFDNYGACQNFVKTVSCGTFDVTSSVPCDSYKQVTT